MGSVHEQSRRLRKLVSIGCHSSIPDAAGQQQPAHAFVHGRCLKQPVRVPGTAQQEHRTAPWLCLSAGAEHCDSRRVWPLFQPAACVLYGSDVRTIALHSQPHLHQYDPLQRCNDVHDEQSVHWYRKCGRPSRGQRCASPGHALHRGIQRRPRASIRQGIRCACRLCGPAQHEAEQLRRQWKLRPELELCVSVRHHQDGGSPGALPGARHHSLQPRSHLPQHHELAAGGRAQAVRSRHRLWRGVSVDPRSRYGERRRSFRQASA